MVTVRGIDVSIVSQLDIHRLLEYNVNTTGPLSSISCLVPIRPGSQIWFEYSIDGPQPVKAIYLFKLITNGQLVTSWDCTERNGYHGKATYALHHTDSVDNLGRISTVLKQHALAFSSKPGSNTCVIEIHVHRATRRRRIRQFQETINAPHLHSDAILRMTGARPVELGRPVRRYEYQLLDAKDEPYATFSFHPCTIDYLEKHALLNLPRTFSPWTSIASQSIYHDTRQESSPVSNHTCDSTLQISLDSPPRTHSQESLSTIARNSIDLASAIPRSPQFPQRPQSQPTNLLDCQDTNICYSGDISPPLLLDTTNATDHPISTQYGPSCLQYTLDVALDPGAVMPGPERRKRSLSPFTSSGFLRRVVGSIPDSRSCTPEHTRGILDTATDTRIACAESEVEEVLSQSKLVRKTVPATALEGMDAKQIGRIGRRWLGFLRGRDESVK